MASTRAGWRKHLARVKPRDRGELMLLLGGVAFLLLLVITARLASEVFEGETQHFDKRILLALRNPADPTVPIGPPWLRSAALDITALGGPTVLGLVVLAVSGFLVLQGMWRAGLFVASATSGAWFINAALKHLFQRPRPDVVSHLRDVMSTSFPSGHALTSAVVYLTLGALTMRIAKRRITKFYCMGMAMLMTTLVGASRVYLGVHYPTDVVAGWLIGLSWALLCWLVERSFERRAGWKRERAEAHAKADAA
ncbi:MAG TPA: phosphatase PAP2 family protein [Thermoanaerobaculia bacterium]|nr:phosphatase PAP2 family protein [Thermoanaerobaculia bacterium]